MADERGWFLLNVDLELESAHDLNPLVEALEPHAYSMERPEGRAAFELQRTPDVRDAEAYILEFVRLVNELPPAARAAWEQASRRVFDIGLQSGRRPFHEGHRLTRETMQAVIAIGAELAVTIYALDE